MPFLKNVLRRSTTSCLTELLSLPPPPAKDTEGEPWDSGGRLSGRPVRVQGQLGNRPSVLEVQRDTLGTSVRNPRHPPWAPCT